MSTRQTVHCSGGVCTVLLCTHLQPPFICWTGCGHWGQTSTWIQLQIYQEDLHQQESSTQSPYSSKSPISTPLHDSTAAWWKHEQAGSWWGVSVVPMSDQAELPLTRCNITLGSRGQTGNNHRITRCQTPGRYCK